VGEIFLSNLNNNLSTIFNTILLRNVRQQIDLKIFNVEQVKQHNKVDQRMDSVNMKKRKLKAYRKPEFQ